MNICLLVKAISAEAASNDARKMSADKDDYDSDTSYPPTAKGNGKMNKTTPGKKHKTTPKKIKMPAPQARNLVLGGKCSFNWFYIEQETVVPAMRQSESQSR